MSARRKKTLKELLSSAAGHHSTLNVFASVVTILEGGHVYDPDAYRAAERIGEIAREEQQRQLVKYDRAIAAAERAGKGSDHA